MKATYIKTKLNNVINISRIVTIHYYEFDRSFVFAGEKHDFWEMVYVDKGRVAVCRDDEEIILERGEIVFHRPDEFHSIRALDSSPNFFVISFVCDSPAMRSLEKYNTVLEKTLHTFISSILREAEKTYLIPKNDTTLRRLVKRNNAPLGGEQLIKTYLEQLLILLVRSITKTGDAAIFPSKESMENHIVRRVREYISENADKKIHIDDICRKVGYSRSYLSRIFHEQTGETLAGFATRVKIDRAKELIREDSKSFTEISDFLGFDNPQYFSRVFKRIENISPTEFRHSLKL